jgi:amino acid transporter
MATHLAWDSFTHPNTWLYRNWQVLREPVNGTTFGAVPTYKVLQHGSTIIGLAALVIWLFLWYRNAKVSTLPEARDEIRPVRKLLILLAVTAIALFGAALRATAAIGIPSNHLATKRFVGLFLVTSISIVWWEFVLYGISRTRRQARTTDPSLRSG